MNTRQLVTFIMNNGGGTFKVSESADELGAIDYQLVEFGSGYMVSKPNGFVLPSLVAGEKMIDECVVGLHDLGNPHHYLGIWEDYGQVVNGIERRIYVDVSVHASVLAPDLGRAWDQKAIWDCKNNEAIYL